VLPDEELRCPNKDLKWSGYVKDLGVWGRKEDDGF
jgi:hypothetical protein